jgi:acetolactate synthase-like protein
MGQQNGGDLIADVLTDRGVEFLFTLCGGHISPILVAAKARGIRVVDVRDEGNAVFAADAVARMTGTAGVAAVTAGPGVTNTVTAVKNAQMAQSPLLLLGGATATVLKGRGSLQDIDQLSLMRPITKWATAVKTVASVGPTVARALNVAQSGVPGPVFVEVPVDLLYDEATVRAWYLKESGVENAQSIAGRALALYLRGHLYRQFHAPALPVEVQPLSELRRNLRRRRPSDAAAQLPQIAEKLQRAERPVLVVGSQALANCRQPERLQQAIERLALPTFLGGMARGLLGSQHRLQFRHNRGKALKEADLVVVAGFPFDFRLGYGRSINARATVISANLSRRELRKNRRPTIAVEMHPGNFLEDLAAVLGDPVSQRDEWFATLRDREVARDQEIAVSARSDGEMVDPLHFFRRMDEQLTDDSVLVVDGGDFVATGSYIVRPRKPLSWLDPGVFGTLGVGGGFATGAALCRPGAEVWLIYGDGSSAYSLAELDTCVRHGVAPIAVVGNDGSWAQIAREQVEMLGDDIGTVLNRCPYHKVAEGYGAAGLLLDDPAQVDATLAQARSIARTGTPVCINVHIARTDFRKGSISM